VSSGVLGGEYMAVKKAAKKPIKESARKVNREGQRWTDDRPGMTLRLPSTFAKQSPRNRA